MILDEIVRYKLSKVESQKKEKPLDPIKVPSKIEKRDFKGAISKDHIAIIAEIKKASPSKGIIQTDFSPKKQAQIYNSADVDAISVLTEDRYFDGKDEYLKLVKDETKKPVLRKDFIVDEYQIAESKSLGADAILLIVAILQKSLKHFYELAKSLELDCLVEVHDEKELEIALKCGCEIVGINNRNLKDFSVDFSTTERLIKNIPDEVTTVSESGIKTVDDVRYLSSIGVDAVLIGETLMRMSKDEILNFIGEIRSI
ncbi:MAG: indole-3-glycerol phosphate synthase TrpC [Thermotogae bacterium]|jgi:indole-3-glycerol phosphate synthase|nr:indole-3-glycerol phosphate synthase TrpC [Thermotogota bacterium]